jgi:transposase-like protein
VAISKRTPEVKSAIVEAVRNGAYAKHAALSAGIVEDTLYTWRKQDAEFDRAIAQAAADRANAAITRITEHAMRDWRADAWLLERTMPAEFREQTATEHSGTLTLASLGELLG